MTFPVFIFDVFRSFLPLHNPIGFGAADFLEFTLAALLVAFILAWPAVEPYARRFAHNTVLCMLLLAALPVALRLALLANHPVPAPEIYDEFSHLLVADTLRHFRFANPPHALNRFFETFFVLQDPTYSSIYPIGQGLWLAIGRAIFRTPWAGVLIATAAFCSLTYWMLRAWISAGWALVGGLLAVIQFGPLNLWMNSYWGGAVAGASGCLVFGALPRIQAQHQQGDAPSRTRRWRWAPALLLGAGLAMHILTRPYESIFLLLSVLLFFAPEPSRLRALAPTAGLVLVALAITALQNRAVTHSWTTLPYQLSQYQYGVPAALTIQPNVTPHRELTPEQQLDYKMQRAFHGEGTDTLATYFERLEYRVRYYRFFFLAPLYLAIPAFLVAVRRYRYAYAWVLVTAALFALGVNLFPAFQFHYIASLSCLFILMAVAGLDQIARIRIRGSAVGVQAANIIVFLCGATFLFWYAMHLFDDTSVSRSMRAYEVWDAIDHRGQDPRAAVNAQLAQAPGKQLVFVRYWPQHIFQNEWVWNEADIDGARVVWARDLGAVENASLIQYYRDRTVWLLEPDFRPPRLSRY